MLKRTTALVMVLALGLLLLTSHEALGQSEGDGLVQRTVLAESSGYDELDSVVQKVAERMVFSPAFNRDKKTAVWLSQSIDFDVG